MARSQELFAFWIAGAVLISWQLFVPPIIGLADQGDFVRILGPLGYAPEPKGPEHKYSYLTRKYVWDPSYREPRWEQISSEFIPATIAVLLNRGLFSSQQFDLTIVGFVHAAFFLLALYRLLRALQPLANYRIAWLAVLFILTDVAYVAYWNSLYTEPASCIWLLFLIAETILLCTSDKVGALPIARWSIFAVLLITAKTQNAWLCAPLAIYGFLLVWRAAYPSARCVAAAGVVAVLAAGVVMYRSLLPAPRLVGIYNMIFMAVLPESKDPASDLKALRLDPKYVQYSGTLAWSPNTGIADGYLVNAVQAAVTPITLVEFYVRRPSRMWTHIRSLLPMALSLRPEFCGNFDPAAGKPPGAKSYNFAIWSQFHERILSSIAVFLLVLVAITPLGCGIILSKRKLALSFRRSLEMAMLLAACCLLAFLSAAFGDAWDNVKHQYLFNLLLDVGIVWVALVGLSALQAVLRKGAGIAVVN